MTQGTIVDTSYSVRKFRAQPVSRPDITNQDVRDCLVPLSCARQRSFPDEMLSDV